MPYTNKSRSLPKMQRAHFEFIAGRLRALMPDRGNTYAPQSVRTKGAAAYEQWKATALDLAASLASTNPNFRRDDFLSACGLEP